MSDLSPFTFILIALATFYSCHTVSQKEGPFSLFARLREALGVKEAANGSRFAPTAWGRLVGCPICLAPYCAVVFVWLWLIVPLVGPWIVVFLALAGASSAVELFIQKR